MERQRSVSDYLLVNMPHGTRQYWQGQYDAFMQCARVLRKAAANTPALELNRLAAALETKARLTAENKLGETQDG